jgi:xyloglucan-specific endo-beta-1,4-glucanase
LYSATSGGSNAYEIMIWLANYNAGPISYNYGSNGQPTPVASNLSIAGHTWYALPVPRTFRRLVSLTSDGRNLYYGSNGSNYVYSFLPTSGTVTAFSGDVNAFLKYLTSNGKIASSQYLTTFQAGTEATSGSGVTFTT